MHGASLAVRETSDAYGGNEKRSQALKTSFSVKGQAALFKK
jgi:hypothetical protein